MQVLHATKPSVWFAVMFSYSTVRLSSPISLGRFHAKAKAVVGHRTVQTCIVEVVHCLERLLDVGDVERRNLVIRFIRARNAHSVEECLTREFVVQTLQQKLKVGSGY